jgi:hypothetical protein
LLGPSKFSNSEGTGMVPFFRTCWLHPQSKDTLKVQNFNRSQKYKEFVGKSFTFRKGSHTLSASFLPLSCLRSIIDFMPQNLLTHFWINNHLFCIAFWLLVLPCGLFALKYSCILL